MAKTSLTELDVIFISYDEDNCEVNYANLLSIVPWAKRVHGVEGSDAAHKAAARLSDTERFISVDADNIVEEKFFDLEFDFDDPKFKDKVISWTAKNAINGLEYGNGGLKCWPVDYVLNMKTHEAADPSDTNNQVDFCWEDTYVQMNNRYSVTHPNGSPKQAFRAGFREGVKMTLDRGGKVENPDNLQDKMWWGNLRRLKIWQSVGRDAMYGEWAMYGARLGTIMTNLSDWDFVNVRDFEHINELFENEVMPKFAMKSNGALHCPKTGYSWDNNLLWSEICNMGETLRKDLGLDIAELDYDESRFFKSVYINVPRTGIYITEDDMNAIRARNQ